MSKPGSYPRARSDDRASVVIVGAGRVGATTAYAAMITGLADAITLVDQDPARAEGEAMDLIHGLPYVPPAAVRSGGFESCREADVVVLTAGAARQPGDTRLDLARRNLDLVGDLVPRIVGSGFDGVLVVVSNPVDLLTLAAARISGLPKERVIGTGTTLDTARLRTMLASHFRVDARNVHSYVVGEHGESEVPVWSLARIANIPLAEFARATDRPWDDGIREGIADQVRRAGAEVIRRKGATHFAIGLATVTVARAILRDERSVLTVGTLLEGEQGLCDAALSLPCVLGREGRIATVPLSLASDEEAALRRSCEVLREAYREAGGPGASEDGGGGAGKSAGKSAGESAGEGGGAP